MPELMKGNKWRDRKDKMTYPAWVEIKFDEIRCHVIVHKGNTDKYTAEFLSYAGKPLHNMQGFTDGFIALYKETGYNEFDCGFEVNGNFNDSYRWTRSSRGLKEDLQGASTKFILFDLPELTHMTFEQRMAIRHSVAVLAIEVGMDNLFQPVGQWAQSADDVDAMFLQARTAGYEGLMVKATDALYVRGGRTDGWLKVKPEDDADGVIVDLIEAVSLEGVPLGRIGSVVVNVEDGSTAKPSGIEFALGADMFNNPAKYIGQWCEFKFMERDRQGGYRHPVFNRVREAKA